MTPYGISTLSPYSSKFNPYQHQSGSIWPNDNWMILKGLKSSGFTKEADLLRSHLIDAMITLKNPYDNGVLEEAKYSKDASSSEVFDNQN